MLEFDSKSNASLSEVAGCAVVDVSLSCLFDCAKVVTHIRLSWIVVVRAGVSVIPGSCLSVAKVLS